VTVSPLGFLFGGVAGLFTEIFFAEEMQTPLSVQRLRGTAYKGTQVESRRTRRFPLITRDECFRISGAIGDKWRSIANARGPLFVPIESRTVLLVSSVGAVIDNGGFRYLLEGHWSGDENLQHAIAAFRQIGCEKAANIIAFAMSHFLLQPGSSSLDPDERLSATDAAFPAEAREEVDRRFWREHDQIEEKLADYVLANTAQIDDQVRINLNSYPPLSK